MKIRILLPILIAVAAQLAPMAAWSRDYFYNRPVYAAPVAGYGFGPAPWMHCGCHHHHYRRFW